MKTFSNPHTLVKNSPLIVYNYKTDDNVKLDLKEIRQGLNLSD
jgi:hypothetical protein